MEKTKRFSQTATHNYEWSYRPVTSETPVTWSRGHDALTEMSGGGLKMMLSHVRPRVSFLLFWSNFLRMDIPGDTLSPRTARAAGRVDPRESEKDEFTAPGSSGPTPGGGGGGGVGGGGPVLAPVGTVSSCWKVSGRLEWSRGGLLSHTRVSPHDENPNPGSSLSSEGLLLRHGGLAVGSAVFPLVVFKWGDKKDNADIHNPSISVITRVGCLFTAIYFLSQKTRNSVLTRGHVRKQYTCLGENTQLVLSSASTSLDNRNIDARNAFMT